MVGLTPLTGRWRVSNRQNRLQRVEWRVSSSKTQATRPARQKLKEWRKSRRSGDDLALLSSDLATFGRPSLRSAQIRPRFSLFLTQICLIPANPTQIYSSLTPTRLNLGQIFIYPKESRPNLFRFGQIWQDSVRFWLKTSELENLKLTDSHPKTDTTRPAWSETSGGSAVGRNLPHLIMSGQVWVGHKPDPARPMDTPNHYFSYLLNDGEYENANCRSNIKITYIRLVVDSRFNCCWVWCEVITIELPTSGCVMWNQWYERKWIFLNYYIEQKITYFHSFSSYTFFLSQVIDL